ncbi:DnaJ domain-containing protein [Litchfieldella xinjiangensis]|uniref:DnaJ domain-containing protein n=1 Tax=Litchfieldella xinjiangensis TaxID=1166948 RepID=UPI0005B77BA0|nr:DnaJ domain-containing protein [Halomonas xinjiangensis]
MPIARFSPFELLLLKSRKQADTAGLMLLAWVLASNGQFTEADRLRLDEVAATFSHGHALEPIFEIASGQALEAVQLAAEIMQKDCCGEQAYPFLRLAIQMAIADGKPTTANHHILRFLADLLGVSPPEFARLFNDVAGKTFENPDDPSRTGYWQAKEHHRHQQEQARQEQQRQQERHSRERHSRQEQSRQEQSRREQAHSGGSGGHRQEQRHHSSHQSPPGDRARRALIVLGLEPGASRSDIRKAYRRLAQTHHPDRFFAQGEAMTASASARFQRIKNAYEYLMQVS